MPRFFRGMFDKKYFDDIWGTVHRHEYCETLANNLIEKYGKVRFLDIGTGCGELVRVLREKGCMAYGLEISEYAVQNSHGNVLLGSVTNIPFKNDSFDVVHSQGLWEYVKEEDILQGWMECNRVGRFQEHNIDTTSDTADWSKDFVTYKSQEWWNEKLKLPKILVACPTHQVKDYAFQKWINCVKALTYPNLEFFVVDNSPTEEYMNQYKDQIPMMRIDATGMEALMVKRLNYSMEEIRKKFLAGNYTWYLNLEVDVIIEPDAIQKLLYWGRDADWISHAYPDRNGNPDELAIQGVGCSIFSRALMEAHGFIELQDNYLPDGGLWMHVRPDNRFKTVELWGMIKIQHLKG